MALKFMYIETTDLEILNERHSEAQWAIGTRQVPIFSNNCTFCLIN